MDRGHQSSSSRPGSSRNPDYRRYRDPHRNERTAKPYRSQADKRSHSGGSSSRRQSSTSAEKSSEHRRRRPTPEPSFNVRQRSPSGEKHHRSTSRGHRTTPVEANSASHPRRRGNTPAPSGNYRSPPVQENYVKETVRVARAEAAASSRSLTSQDVNARDKIPQLQRQQEQGSEQSRQPSDHISPINETARAEASSSNRSLPSGAPPQPYARPSRREIIQKRLKEIEDRSQSSNERTEIRQELNMEQPRETSTSSSSQRSQPNSSSASNGRNGASSSSSSSSRQSKLTPALKSSGKDKTVSDMLNQMYPVPSPSMPPPTRPRSILSPPPPPSIRPSDIVCLSSSEDEDSKRKDASKQSTSLPAKTSSKSEKPEQQVAANSKKPQENVSGSSKKLNDGRESESSRKRRLEDANSNDINLNAPSSSDETPSKKAKTATPSPPNPPSFSTLFEMSTVFANLLVDKPRENKYYTKSPDTHSPRTWTPKSFTPEPEPESVDDGYDSSNNIHSPRGNGPCGSTSTQQKIALDIHCINRILKSISFDERYKILKSFIDEKTACTIFFYIHAKEFEYENESIVARVALQRIVMVLNNALQLYEMLVIPEIFHGKEPTDPYNEHNIPFLNSYRYDGPGYREYDRAGTSHSIAVMYTEFTRAETNMLLDAHMLIQHAKELDLKERRKYIKRNANRVFQWLDIIKSRVRDKQHNHHNFIIWCHLGLIQKNASNLLTLLDQIFETEMKSISESLKKEFGDEKPSPLQHQRYYQAALKGLNCKDFGIEKFYCRDDNLWYTALVGSFFNDICGIEDGEDDLFRPFIEAFREAVDATKDVLQQKYGNFQQLIADNEFWKKIIEKKCQDVPEPLDLYKNLAAFIFDLSQKDPNAFDYTAKLIHPFNPELKKHIKNLASMVYNNNSMKKKDTLVLVQIIVDELMAHFYPVLQTIDKECEEQSAAVRLLTIYVLKGFLMEWEEYNRWKKEMRDGKKYDREGTGLNLPLIKEYFGKDFMSLPSNIMTAIWERKFNDRFFSPKVPKDIRILLTYPEFKILPAKTITNILDFFETIDESDLDVEWFLKNAEKKSFGEEDLFEDIDAEKEVESNASDSSGNSSSNNVDLDLPVQAQPPSPGLQVHPTRLGLSNFSRFERGPLSRWALKMARSDFAEKGDNFVIAPVNQPKEERSANPTNQNSSDVEYPFKINFQHPVLKAFQEKCIRDAQPLFPEMCQWAASTKTLLEDILSKTPVKKKCVNGEGIQRDQAAASATNESDDPTNSTSIDKNSYALSNSLTEEESTEKQLQLNLKYLSPYPLLAVCSSKVSVIYPFPIDFLKSPHSNTILERHELKSPCTLWDYVQGKSVKFDPEILKFLCYMWKRTVQFSKKRKANGTLFKSEEAMRIIKDIQNGGTIQYRDLVKHVIGIRFDGDLRKNEALNNFCTMYIDVNALSLDEFKFHFDIKISDKNLYPD